MRRKKTPAPRRRRALRWVGALCLLLAACHFTDIYVLTLGRSLGRQDQYWLGGRTELEEVVRDPWCREGGIGVVTASKSDRVVALGLSRWTPLRGWVPGFYWPEERTGGAVDAVAAYYSWDAEAAHYPYAVYGCINAPWVTEVQLTYRERHWPEGDLGPERTVTPELRTAGDGIRYFLEVFETEGICDGLTWTARGGGRTAGGKIQSMSLIYDWGNM